MLDRDNILGIINQFQAEMDDLEIELKKTTNENVRYAIKNRLGDLADNKYRHELQARAWGLMPTPSLPIPGKEQDGKTEEKGISPGKERDGKTEESD